MAGGEGRKRETDGERERNRKMERSWETEINRCSCLE